MTTTYRIRHYYDIGNQDVFIAHRHGEASVDPKRAALYCQFKSEEWFDEGSALTNLGIAALLTMFYGFRQAPAAGADDCVEIEMYSERSAACGDQYRELMADSSLHREGLRVYMRCFLD